MDYLQPRHDSEKIDLAFIVDCTGSMGSYIKQVQKHVQYIAETIARTSFDVHLALIEYRDHPPQDRSFVTRVHDFTSDVKEMKTWVDQMAASGGGDWPEAVADALQLGTRLSYRKQSTKMCVLIADAPPHGLDENGDGFPNGCPKGHDPLTACHLMAQKGIVLYCIGCEPSVDAFRDFLVGLAHITGGQYVPLRQAKTLTKVIISAAQEEVSLEKLMGHASDFVYLKMKEMKSKKKDIKVDDLAKEFHEKMKLTGNKGHTLQMNDKPLDPVTPDGKQYSHMTKMSEAKAFYKSKKNPRGRYGGSMKNVDGSVVICENIEMSGSQSLRIINKTLARNKVPVTHCEKSGMVILFDTVPDKLDMVH